LQPGHPERSQHRQFVAPAVHGDGQGVPDSTDGQQDKEGA